MRAIAAKIGAEWQESPRLRYGLFAIVLIFWVYGLLILNDAITAERNAWQNTESRVVRARSTAESADWPRRAQDVTAAVGDFESILWRDGSLGLSQAAFHERVTQSFSSAGVTVRSLRVATVIDAAVPGEMSDIVPLRARAQIEFRPAHFYSWLAELNKMRADKRPSIGIESLTIRASTTGQISIADLELVGYFLKGGTSAIDLPADRPPATTTGPRISK